MKKYPRLGSKRKSKGAAPCIICRGPATNIVDVQYNIFRGDDEVYRLCDGCLKKDESKILKELDEKG